MSAPKKHPFDVQKMPCYHDRWAQSQHIRSLDQLYWGLYRFYTDALLYFGNIRAAFQQLTQLTESDLTSFFQSRRVDTNAILKRGEPIHPHEISKDNRHLISEMACKSFGASDAPQGELKSALMDLYEQHCDSGGGRITVRQLLTGAYSRGDYKREQLQFDLSIDDILDDHIDDKSEPLDKDQPGRK